MQIDTPRRRVFALVVVLATVALVTGAIWLVVTSVPAHR